MRSIILNNKIIEYDMKFNSKKNVNIHIGSDLRLKVSAPRWVVKREVERILTEKSSWILHNLELQRKNQREQKVNTLENGHTIWFHGEKYRLYYKAGEKNFVFIAEDQIIVFSKKVDDLEYSQNIFKKWLKSVAEVEFKEALQKYRNMMLRKYYIPECTLQIRAMKTRWGTCTPAKKRVTLNLYLIYAPHEYMEYIALHELAHFIEFYHNEHFYSIIKEFMPDYEERKNKLNKEYSHIAKDK